MKPCVVIPTYENPRTLADTVRGALATVGAVLVVDDGSGEATARVLVELSRAHPELVVLRHPRNRGKGAALRTGFRAARERGFTHAVSMDSDGQHLAREIPRLLAEARAHPEAIILGARDLRAAGAGPGSRFGRLNSNFWVWVITGQRLPDTQTGFRCYPLAPLSELALFADGYGFEVEVLVRACWSGIPVRAVPVEVRYLPPGERVSHLRLRNHLRIAHLNARFVTQKICLPPPYLRLRSQRRFHELGFRARWGRALRTCFVEDPGPPGRLAAAVALGLFWGLAPVWGFQILLTLLTAGWLRLSKPIAVIASHVSFPLLIPPILYASLLIGRWLLGLPGSGAPPPTARALGEDALAWALGSLLLAASAAVVGGLATYCIARLLRRLVRRSGAGR
ncbi:MAG: DUF2062 domain-containing protein [Planctomycetota bacterium]|nr:MAG: DUF2062 domain-containing protein [Planctomycetota bacterium]